MDIIRICKLGGDKKSLIEKDAKVTPRVHINKRKPLKTRIFYECGLCGQMFGNRKYNMARHLERCVERHEEETAAIKEGRNKVPKKEIRTKYSCVLCPPEAAKWVSLNYLEIHMESVHNVRELRRQCSPPDGTLMSSVANKLNHYNNRYKKDIHERYRVEKRELLRQNLSRQSKTPQQISVITPNPYYNSQSITSPGVIELLETSLYKNKVTA